MRKLIIKNLNPATPIWLQSTIKLGADKNSIKALQLALWDAGYFKGITKNGKLITYKQAVDGKMGSVTKQAMANYEKSQLPETLGWLPEETLEEIKAKAQAYNEAREAGRKRAARLDFTIDLSKEPEKPSRVLRVMETVSAPGYSAPAAQEFLLKSGEEFYIPAFFTPVFNNMYPYSYGAKVYRNGQWTPYDGSGLKKGEKLRLTTGSDNPTDLLESMAWNVWSAVKGKDPRRDIMDKMASLDLDNPEDRKLWDLYTQEGRKLGVIRTSGNPKDVLWEMLARLENMHRFNTGKSKYDIYEVNPDYSSATATAAGAPTYRIKDPKQRERINGQMYNFYKKRIGQTGFKDFAKMSKEDVSSYPYYKVSEKNDTTYFVPDMTYLGNAVLVADSPNGANMRYVDKWDYIGPANAGGHDFYTGDRLADENGRPLYRTSGVGHNTPGFTESMPDLVKAAATEYIKQFKKQFKL